MDGYEKENPMTEEQQHINDRQPGWREENARRWRSCALWPEGTTCGENPTKDTHNSRDYAQHICDKLQREGFGGDLEIFPVRTWVEEV